MGCWELEGQSPLLRSRQPDAQEMQQPENPGVAHAKVAVSWSEVEEVRARQVG